MDANVIKISKIINVSGFDLSVQINDWGKSVPYRINNWQSLDCSDILSNIPWWDDVNVRQGITISGSGFLPGNIFCFWQHGDGQDGEAIHVYISPNAPQEPDNGSILYLQGDNSYILTITDDKTRVINFTLDN